MQTTTYNSKHKLILLESDSEVEELFSNGIHGQVALNIEATGRDYVKDSVVGVNVAVSDDDSVRSYYMPLRHNGYSGNLNVHSTLGRVHELIKSSKVLFFKRDFVFAFLEKEGYECDLYNTNDVQIMIYLCTNKSCPARNDYARIYFPDMDIFEIDVDEVEFSNRNPQIAYIYAAQKSVLTILLARYVWQNYPMIHDIYKLDNISNEVVRWFSKNTSVPFDRSFVSAELDSVNSGMESVKYQVRSILGYDIDWNNYADRVDILRKFMNIGDDVTIITNEMLNKCEHPVAQLLKRYGEFQSYKTTLEKMLSIQGDMRINYSTVTARTGRLTSGHINGNSFFSDFNIHNVLKREVCRYVHKTEDGIGFIVNDKEEGSVKSVKCKAGLRDAFVCPSDEYVWVSCDYSGEEMCLAANFSHEENLIEPIKNGADIHSYVSEKVLGYKDADSRSVMKQINFSVIYGASEFSIAKKLGITEEKCHILLGKYYSLMSNLALWREKMIHRARTKGYVSTLFGRPRMLYTDYQSSDRFDHEAADRYACNSPIQGCTPLNGHLEIENAAVRMSVSIGKRFKDYDKHDIVPSHRDKADPLFVLFKSGDYIICDHNHQLIYNSMQEPKVASIRNGFKNARILLAPLHKKKFRFSMFVFRKISECVGLFTLTCSHDDIVKDTNKDLNSALFRLALERKWFKADYESAISMRSIASIFGYNVVYSDKKDKFRVTLGRRSKSAVKRIWWCFNERHDVEMGTCTQSFGFQTYYNQGVVNKNTGADILRIVLCRFKKLFDTDPEWRENVRFANTVHDECNFYVKKSYLKKGVEKIYNTMYFQHPLCVLPIKGSVSVGADWGHLLEVDINDIDDNNKVKI